jgi:uncharacterized protein (DUF4213/DUF364 family)
MGETSHDPLIAAVLAEAGARAGTRDAAVLDVRVGPYWTAVATTLGAGLASTLAGEGRPHHGRPIPGAGGLLDLTPLELAGLAASSSVPEAAIGLAAVNALLGVPAGRVDEANAADVLVERGRGRRVALLGEFPFTGRLREAAGELAVFERGPARRPEHFGRRDLAVVVPRAEVVAITATTLANRTLGGILEHVADDAFLMMLGPSTPMCATLLDRGFDVLCGTVVDDPDTVLLAVGQGATTPQITGVRRLCLWRE